MTEQLADLMANFPAYLGGHILLSISALTAALLISLPVGILASSRPRLAESFLAAAGVIQTVPSLALLGLAVFALGGLIGFVPAFLALVLYSILPILANTVVGIRGVDPTLIEAARGLGMSDRQMLWRVQLPLAAPIIISGVRTATVLAVGTATLATPVGGLSLGNYIFAGLSMLNHTMTVFGCIAAALLAVILDQLVRLLEIAAQRRSVKLGLLAAGGLALVAAGGLYEPVTRWLKAEGNHGIVASTSFTEQYVLSDVIARRLSVSGFQPDQRAGMGDGIRFEALRRGQVDCLVTYTGEVWTSLMKQREASDRAATLRMVRRYLEDDFKVVFLGNLGFENAYAMAMAPRLAEREHLRSIDDLARLAKERLKQGQRLRIAGDLEFFERAEWRRIQELYSIRGEDVEIKPMSQTLMYAAVVNEQVDAILAYTSDGRIKAFDLQLLDDPRQAFPPYDAILLVSLSAARRPGFLDALRPLLGAIDLKTMQEANRRVDVEQQPPSQAGAWLTQQIDARR